ncbi:ACT domain-containing protein [uncultured Marinococcus sp.]|uniref:ACT domain-containing protein n=1 Tax=Marinococcus sp. PL1-022 TaxID=3095363 RepID=UPI0026226249|nr:ACT domain-containing protein [uncultured Marinococcus sp.]
MDHFYLVREDLLTDAMQKTLEAKALLESGKVQKVAEAVQHVDLSRSAFYKYRDAIFPFHTMIQEQIITLSIQLADRSGSLSELLRIVAEANSNVLTINQTIPLQGRANITLTVDTSALSLEIRDFVRKIQGMEFVEKAEIVGSGSL